jgi:hypothetical protein
LDQFNTLKNIAEPSYDDEGPPELPNDEFSIIKSGEDNIISKVSFGISPI